WVGLRCSKTTASTMYRSSAGMHHLRDWWCPLCLATSVYHVLKSDTAASTSTFMGIVLRCPHV
ncbi:MAG TPA: hypothetical protein VG015_06295, partial [Candidatus Dormibacteraeota bacterium]|nr:hypothetical protein [Candidatus Dormibacteraeota bacterium]